MAATFNESQQLDYLWKKLGYGVAKTAATTGAGAKQAYNESIASPLLYRGDLIWTQSASIPASPPSNTTDIVQVYKDGGGGGYSPTVECTEDLTSPDNQTWLTNLTNWIPTQFGDNYLVQVYAANVGVNNPQTVGTKLFQSGSGNDDTWYFDYQAGVLNFNGANIPSVITGGVTGKSIYIVGYRYVGIVGLSGGAATGTSISNGSSNVNVVSSGGNVTVGIGGTGNVVVFSNTGAYVSGAVSASGNVTGNNVNVVGLSLSGNVLSNINSTSNITTTANIAANYFIGNGSQLTGIDATSIQNGNSNVKVYANGNITTSVNGTANVVVVTDTGAYITGLFSVTGNVISGNVVTSSVTSSSDLLVGSGNNGNVSLSANGSGIVKVTGPAGLVIPAGNTGQRPVSVDTGTLRFNTTLNAVEVYNLTSWEIVGSNTVPQTVLDQQIVPNGSNVTYTLNQTATAASIMVTINGVTQIPNDGYSVVGNVITFAEAPLSTDYVDIRFLTSPVATPGLLVNTGGNSAVLVSDTPYISLTVSDATRMVITANGIVDISTGRSLKLPLYTVAQANNMSGITEGEMIYVQNGDSGAACLAVFSSGSWKRVVLGASISG